jgi:hypothetical protein
MNNLLRQSKLFLKRNSSTILTCIGGVGVVATAVMVAKETPKALALLEKAKEEKGEELTKLETVKVAAPAYIPAAVTGAATIACIFGANVLSKRQQASLVSAYALLDSSYKDYRGKVIELYGEDAHDAVKEEIAKDKYEESEVSLEDENKQLFYDDFSRRYFEATMEKVVHAEYSLNRRLALSNFCCLNEFYDLLEIEAVAGGDDLGWYGDDLTEHYSYQWIEFEHKKVVMDDGLECYIVTMITEPYADYMDY